MNAKDLTGMPTTPPQAAATGLLERLFKLREHGTTPRTEVIAGITTFLTMAYIIFVNPSILGDAGMPKDAVFVATCLIAALGSAIMGLYANYPELIRYKRCRSLRIACDEESVVNVDGEALYTREAEIAVVPQAIRFFYPKGLTYRVKN